MLCVVDDAQWLDHESLDALALVTRRLYAERVTVVLAVRDGLPAADRLEGIDEIALSGLGDDDALELLGSVVTGPLASHVAARIVSETAGSPMAIVELAQQLSDQVLAGSDVLPDRLPLSARLEAHFLGQVRALSDGTQTLLLVAAADPLASVGEVTEAAALLGVEPEATELERAFALLEMRPSPRFRHPLIVRRSMAGLRRWRVEASTGRWRR